MVLSKILGPSPMTYSFKKINQLLLLKGGHQDTIDTIIDDGTCISDEAFFEAYVQKKKPRRMTNQELANLYDSTATLTKEQKLIKSVLDDCIANSASKTVSDRAFENARNMYIFRRKYRLYLRIKRFIPLCVIAPFTNSELSKMAFAAALGSKSVSLTLPGLIGYSLPAFYFFHMSYYYGPDKLKPVCNFCKYVAGAPFWVLNAVTDEIFYGPEERFFGQNIPIDITQTGGTIPGDIGDLDKLRERIEEMNEWLKKSY